MSPNIEVVETKLFVGVIADEIVASVRDSISERGKCSLVLSGGSTPSVLYRTLSKPPRVSDIEWNNVDLYWGDERWVPHDHTHSNYRMVNETLLEQIQKSEPRVHAVNTTLASPEEGARDYANQIRKAEGLTGDQVPTFDIVLLGIGEDGHTASIFPHSVAFKESDSTICVSVLHPDGGHRITLLPGVLFNARKVFFIVKGDSKADIMRRVIEGNDTIEDIPARLFQKASHSVTFFLDSGAALKLDKARV